MFALSLSWIFTVVFAATGVYSLLRLAELSHLLMSVAMIAMAWGWSGDASSASGVLQIAVFGLVALWFGAHLGLPAPGHSRLGDGYHLVMNAAMVWMVAAMPLIMGATATGDSGGHHGDDGMAGMPGMGGAVSSDGAAPGAGTTPAWATVVSALFVVLLVASAVFWVARVVRVVRVVPVARAARPAAQDGDAVPTDATGLEGERAGALAVAAPAPPPRVVGPLPDAGCHLLMSLGMAGMLLAML